VSSSAAIAPPWTTSPSVEPRLVRQPQLGLVGAQVDQLDPELARERGRGDEGAHDVGAGLLGHWANRIAGSDG
jgi:hypothetical protein